MKHLIVLCSCAFIGCVSSANAQKIESDKQPVKENSVKKFVSFKDLTPLVSPMEYYEGTINAGSFKVKMTLAFSIGTPIKSDLKKTNLPEDYHLLTGYMLGEMGVDRSNDCPFPEHEINVLRGHIIGDIYTLTYAKYDEGMSNLNPSVLGGVTLVKDGENLKGKIFNFMIPQHADATIMNTNFENIVFVKVKK